MSEYGNPTAKKVSGCAYYLPAVTTPFGPKPLNHTDRYDTPAQAKAAAKRILAGKAEATSPLAWEGWKMGRYGKNMRDCCDSVAQPGTPHIRGCRYFGEHDPYYWECATCGKGSRNLSAINDGGTPYCSHRCFSIAAVPQTIGEK